MKGRRVALVGGAGFIGHKLALELKQLGAHVEIIDGLQVNNLVSLTADIDRLQNKNLYLHLINERLQLIRDADIPLHVLDARDYQVLSRTLDIVDAEVIVHLAAVAHAGFANKNPYTTFDHSLRTLENALDHARSTAKHFVFFSSSMVYGNFPSGGVTEETPCDPIGIYGALKFAGERLVIAYNQVFDLPYTIVRPSALYGERCVSRRVIQVFIENALSGRPLEITGDGSEYLDFTYIDDLVQGVVKVTENEKAKNEIFNITYGRSRSIADLVEILKDRFPSIEVRNRPSDRLMPERGTLSVEKARDLISYEPRFPLEEGVDSYATWYEKLFENHPALFAPA